jgi:hypothetical protein
MKFFITLTPAENLLIRDGRDVSLKKLLETTFKDLLLKRVLKMEHADDETADPNEQMATYVIKGEELNSYAPLSHEQIFLRHLPIYGGKRILLRTLIKMVFENSEGEKKYRRLVSESPRIIQYFKNFWLFQAFGYFPLNSKGKEVREQILSERTTLTEELSRLWDSDRRKALEIIDQIKGNVFLLPLSKDIINSISVEFDRMPSSNVGDSYSAGGCGGFFYPDFHHVSTGFDQGGSDWSDSSGSESGCGGDSGGDSGCGNSGCGGCGGGD